MSIKDILVHVDDNPQCEHRLDLAIAMATENDAHLTGVYITHLPFIPSYVEAQMSEEVIHIQRQGIAETTAKVKKGFIDKTEAASVSAEWRAREGLIDEILALHGRYTDLLIVGQRDPEGDEISSDDVMPDHLILSVGRPVLVVPKSGTYANVGKRVAVAWDGSRTATRAINDAMPILEAADKVSIIVVDPHGGADGHGEEPGADICRHLARLGITAEVESFQSNGNSPADILMTRASNGETDLLVMGAYGHARWREVIMGGVTRQTLDRMTVPVLMSH